MLSLMVHLAGGSLYGLISRAVIKELPQFASLRTPDLPKSDVIRLEKAQQTPAPVAAAKPHPKPPAPPPPVPHVAQQLIPAPVEQQHELAHVVIHAPRQTAPSRGEGFAEIPHVIRPAAGPKVPKHQVYSTDQIADMTGAFAKAIADSHQTVAQANAAVQSAPETMKHVQMAFTGIHEGMNPGDGIINVVSASVDHGVKIYWTHYEYMYGDGHVEEDDIPWPFRYPPGLYDPFAHHDRRVPIQAPPAGYVPNRPLKPILQAFFGGPPPPS
jgi:hypothetical protein